MDALDAISLNGNGRHVVGASRSSIRVYSIINGSVEAVYEHRYPRNKRFAYYSSGCVSWSPVSDDLIASTSLNGAVMLWQPQVGLLERNYRAHSVAATAINFSRHDKNILVSGGKDGSVLAYDLRQKHPIANYKSGCQQAIRDVQFSDTSNNFFVVADDSGSVRYWDSRKANECLKEFSVHFGSVNSISLQHGNLLATAGKDKFLRVWDWENGELLYWIETVANVSKVAWDPNNQFHVLSCSNTPDGAVHIFDVRRPYLPYASFDAHRDVCTGIAWIKSDADVFLSCGKDGRIVKHHVQEGEVPARHVSIVSLDTSPSGTLVTSVKQHVRKHTTIAQFSSKQRHPMGKVEPSLLCVNRSGVIESEISDRAFTALAKEYIFDGGTYEEICHANAKIAKRLRQPQTASNWKILAIVLGELNLEELEPERPETPPEEEEEKEKEEEEEKEEQEEEALPEPSESRRESKSGEETKSETAEPEKEGEPLIPTATLEQFFPNGIPDNLTAGTDMYFGPEEFNIQGMSSESFPNVHALFGNGRCSANIPDDFFEPRQELPEWSEHDFFYDDSSFASFTRYSGSQLSMGPSDRISDSSALLEQELMRLSLPTKQLTFDALPVLIDTLYSFSEEGDIQMCAMICLVMNDRVHHIVKDKKHALVWIQEYIEILEHFELWNVTAMIIKSSIFPEILALGNESTFYKLSCLGCKTPTATVSSSCVRCKKEFDTTCILCLLPAGGIWTGCNRCGHGGHHGHLQDWFKMFANCPYPGCKHYCRNY